MKSRSPVLVSDTTHSLTVPAKVAAEKAVGPRETSVVLPAPTTMAEGATVFPGVSNVALASDAKTKTDPRRPNVMTLCPRKTFHIFIVVSLKLMVTKTVNKDHNGLVL